MRAARILMVLPVLAVLACGDDPTDPDITKIEFAPELGIDLSQMTRTPSGLYVQDLTVGTGATAQAGDILSVLYSGWLANGTQFGLADDPTDPLIFQLGVGDVIQGWDEGVVGMREGGRRRLVIPPKLGYGSRPNGPIPANSVLVFEVELLTVQ